MINLGITNALSEIYLFQHITKLERPVIRAYLISLAGFVCSMISLFCFFKFAEYFFEAALTNALLALGGNFNGTSFIIIFNITIAFQVFYEITHAIFLICELVFFIELIHPLQRFVHITICMSEQLHK